MSVTEKLGQQSVVVMNSYLEVDVSRWLSENEIPYAYEVFTIPSVLSGRGQDDWNDMVEGIRAIGRGEEEQFERLKEGTFFEDKSAFEVLNKWNSIYDKHLLANEAPTPPVRESLSDFQKQFILPDFTIYKGVEERTKPIDWDGWTNFDFILEVGGLYGVGIPEGAEDEWWEWYRVSGVAFKELIYYMLDLLERTFFVVPFQPFIEGVSDGIPNQLRDDPRFIIFTTTQAEIDLSELADALGVTTEAIPAGLSTPITPTEYQRPRTADLPGEFNVVEYSYDGININNVDNNENAVVADRQWIVFHGDLGEVFISDNSVHVKESQWKQTNMILLREYVLDVLSRLQEDEIVEGLEPI